MPAPDPNAQLSAVDRFAWLDVARAIAVMAVAIMHLLDPASPSWHTFNHQFFNPGVFGVVLFFIVSGFVIPMSLERRGSLRVFVTTRFFRLYPLYWASLIAVMAMLAFKWGSTSLDFSDPARLRENFLWNLTMWQQWVGVPDAIGLYWTLAYELVFYTACVVMNRRTDVVVALGAAYLLVRGVILPLKSDLPYVNPQDFWLLTFFVGTLWYRGWSGEFSVRRVILVTALFVGSVAANFATAYGVLGLKDQPQDMQKEATLSAWVAAYVTFGVLLWLRRVSWPRALTWLGRVSYSIYLMHGVLLVIDLQMPPLAAFGVRLTVLLPLCAVTYHYIERPMVALGHRLTNRERRPVEKSASAKPSTGLRALGALLASVLIAVGIGLVGEQLWRERANERHTIDFDEALTRGSVLVAGWSLPEGGGPDAPSVAWCEARECIVDVAVPDAQDRTLRMRLAPFQYDGGPEQRLTVTVNEHTLGTGIAVPGWATLSFKASREVWRAGSNQVRLRFTLVESPKGKVPGAVDERKLAALFDWIDVKSIDTDEPPPSAISD
jgi:peptidoglycan/LPS O-acetylase OafA/YrhL